MLRFVSPSAQLCRTVPRISAPTQEALGGLKSFPGPNLSGKFFFFLPRKANAPTSTTATTATITIIILEDVNIPADSDVSEAEVTGVRF